MSGKIDHPCLTPPLPVSAALQTVSHASLCPARGLEVYMRTARKKIRTTGLAWVTGKAGLQCVKISDSQMPHSRRISPKDSLSYCKK